MGPCPMIPNQAEFLEALRLVTAAFDKLGIQYAVGGSYASSVYGEARATRDVEQQSLDSCS